VPRLPLWLSKGNISPGLKAANVPMGCEQPKFDEVVSAALVPSWDRLGFVLFGYRLADQSASSTAC